MHPKVPRLRLSVVTHLLIGITAFLPSKALARDCYFPNGTVHDPTVYQPCSDTTVNTMCCAIGPSRQLRDTCLPSGLCEGHFNGNQTWRESCTDPTWQSPYCVRLCMDYDDTDVQLTQCDDGTYCCGAPGEDAVDSCCKEGKGFKYDVNTPNIPQNRTSSSTASSSTTTPSATASTTPSSSSTPASSGGAKTAAVAGGTVGGVAGAVLVLAGLLLWRRKKYKNPPLLPAGPGTPVEIDGFQQHKPEGPGAGMYTNSSQLQQRDVVELPARTTGSQPISELPASSPVLKPSESVSELSTSTPANSRPIG